ncbi:winged helix-turn-helix transcriptional regulator [Neobacillus sp. YIM B02564]|uniref:Winged helix-turn-helix transcriptional regulator n=2 Tax=Neobacillus paridis TaxID=2803862 RepID=A0ABS1THI9_9BACI|nr:winged helix-turn-helix transcriptional regulator [Neobacillus paridis]
MCNYNKHKLFRVRNIRMESILKKEGSLMEKAFNNEILKSFHAINKLLFHVTKQDADKNGLTVGQLFTLFKISANPNIGLVELADKIKLTNSTVSGIVSRLVQNGLVEREALPHDRRSVTIRLTQKGEQKLVEVFSSESLLVEKLEQIKQLPEEEIQNLLRLHEKIKNILSE